MKNFEQVSGFGLENFGKEIDHIQEYYNIFGEYPFDLSIDQVVDRLEEYARKTVKCGRLWV